MKPLSHPGVSKLLRYRVESPLRRRKCGELVEVLKMKPAESPGMNTVLNPETLDTMRSGVAPLESSVDNWASTLDGIFGKTEFVSLRKLKLA
jgi:hypothetical protein